jgi:hypothetical protein
MLHYEDDINDDVNKDVQQLTQYWMNERCTPEILEYQGQIIDSLMELLNAQVSSCPLLRSQNKVN